jgi:hypothetical protein
MGQVLTRARKFIRWSSLVMEFVDIRSIKRALQSAQPAPEQPTNHAKGDHELQSTSSDIAKKS